MNCALFRILEENCLLSGMKGEMGIDVWVSWKGCFLIGMWIRHVATMETDKLLLCNSDFARNSSIACACIRKVGLRC